MLSKMTRVFIGKDIDRTSAISTGDPLPTVLQNIAEGELVILDKNKNVLSATATYAEGTATDTIYIIEGLGETVSVTPESGSAITIRKVLTSDPIEGKNILKFEGEYCADKSEQVITFDLTSVTPVVGTEYFIRIVYKDMHEHPGQFTATYRVVSTDTDRDTLGAALVAKIMAHSGRRVSASYNSSSDVITLTGLPIPDCTSSVNDIDKFKMVEFDAFLNYVDSDGNWQTFVGKASDTPVSYGNGTWEQVRDAEKFELGYLGVTNQTKFPVIKPDMRTVKDEKYSTIVIEHRKSYVAPNNQGPELASLRTVIYFPCGSGQGCELINKLNQWFGSLPGNFSAVLSKEQCTTTTTTTTTTAA